MATKKSTALPTETDATEQLGTLDEELSALVEQVYRLEALVRVTSDFWIQAPVSADEEERAQQEDMGNLSALAKDLAASVKARLTLVQSTALDAAKAARQELKQLGAIHD